MKAAESIGDDRLQRQAQGTVVPESFTHGSAEQRVANVSGERGDAALARRVIADQRDVAKPSLACTKSERSARIPDLRSHGFVIASDECYSELYYDEASPPVGALQAARALGREGFRRLGQGTGARSPRSTCHPQGARRDQALPQGECQ